MWMRTTSAAQSASPVGFLTHVGLHRENEKERGIIEGLHREYRVYIGVIGGEWKTQWKLPFRV